jgi:copper ion binding protein
MGPRKKGKKKPNPKGGLVAGEEECSDDGGRDPPDASQKVDPIGSDEPMATLTSEAESSRGNADVVAPDPNEDDLVQALRGAGEIGELENQWAELPHSRGTNEFTPEPALDAAVAAHSRGTNESTPELALDAAAVAEQTKLRVRGMTCGKCVGRVQRHLGRVEGVISAEADFDSECAFVNGTATLESMCAALQSNGYDGTLWDEVAEAELLAKRAAASAKRQWKLYVDGMTCIKCVGRVKRYLQSVGGVDAADVDLTSATAWVEGCAQLEALCAVLNDNGYSACEWSEEAAAAAERRKAAANAVTATATSATIAADDFNPRSATPASEQAKTQKLHVGGMTCGKCVGRVKRHLESVAGVLNADVDLDSASAVVHGCATLEAMCSVLCENGYEGREWAASTAALAGSVPGSSGYHAMDFNPRVDEFNPRAGGIAPAPSTAPILVVDPAVDVNMASTRLLVSGMTCGACVARVEKEVISALSRAAKSRRKPFLPSPLLPLCISSLFSSR